MQEAFIVAYKRTPVGGFLGQLSGFSAPQLGAHALKAALLQAGLAPHEVEQIIVGNVLSANLGQAPATQVAKLAGLPETTAATLVNKVCASGSKAAMLAAQSIRLEEAGLIAVVGMESMSNVPFYLPSGRTGSKYGNVEMLDGIVRDGLQDVYSGHMMGEAGEQLAENMGFTRQDQDAYAAESYRRALAAVEKLKAEIAPITLSTKKGEVVVDADEDPTKVDFAKLPTLRPVFRPNGTITAANASNMNDGAAALLLASGEAVKRLNLKPLARMVSWADAQRTPMEFTIAPADALPVALKRGNLSTQQVDRFEVNEAFSVVALANQRLLDLDPAKLNVNGGAVSIGHPLGCSGARILGTLITELQASGGHYGALGICNGGGGASAVVIERV